MEKGKLRAPQAALQRCKGSWSIGEDSEEDQGVCDPSSIQPGPETLTENLARGFKGKLEKLVRVK